MLLFVLFATIYLLTKNSEAKGTILKTPARCAKTPDLIKIKNQIEYKTTKKPIPIINMSCADKSGLTGCCRKTVGRITANVAKLGIAAIRCG